MLELGGDGGHFAVSSQSYHGNRVAIRLLLVVTRQQLTIYLFKRDYLKTEFFNLNKNMRQFGVAHEI